MLVLPVKIFVPKIPEGESSQEEFISYVKNLCAVANIRIARNKDNTTFSIITVNESDSYSSVIDLIKEMQRKQIGEVSLKPRIYVDQSMFNKLRSNPYVPKESSDDIVNTTHFSGGFYYVQLLSQKEQNQHLSAQLRHLLADYRSGTVLSVSPDDLIEGQLYATFYDSEHQLFRIKVLSQQAPTKRSNSNEIRVLFIDYGNVETINKDKKKIVPISSKVREVPPMAHQCQIMDVKIINEEKHELMAREVINRTLRARLRRDPADPSRVIALDYIDFSTITYRSFLVIEDIAEETAVCGHPRKLLDASSPGTRAVSSLSEKCNGFKQESVSVILTHFESLDEFYVQPINQETSDHMTTLAGLISQFLSDHNLSSDKQMNGDRKCDWSEVKDENSDERELFVGQFTQDNNWYRCRIIRDATISSSTSDNTNNNKDESEGLCVVQYIDYGNTEVKRRKDLFSITANGDKKSQLAEMPPCARLCRFSDDLVYALSSANLERDYFHNEIVQTEQPVTLNFNHDRSNLVWIVENVTLGSGEDLQAVIDKRCESRDPSDYYRLGNLESLDKVWFQLVKTVDPVRYGEICTIDKWSSKERLRRDQQSVKTVNVGGLYSARIPVQHSTAAGSAAGTVVRCRVLARNRSSAVIQCLDTGCYDTVPCDSIYPITDETVSSVPPLAQKYRFFFTQSNQDSLSPTICVEPRQIEERISQILGNNLVKLDVLLCQNGCGADVDGTNCGQTKDLRDVIINQKSLVQCLVQLDYIQPVVSQVADTSNPRPCNHQSGHPDNSSDSLLFSIDNYDIHGNTIVSTGTTNAIDFSLPNLDSINKVPLEISILNGHVKVLRKLLSGEVGGESIIDRMFNIETSLDGVHRVIDHCRQVDDLSQSFDLIETESGEIVRNLQCKLRDLDPLIERRKGVCESIHILHTELNQLLNDISLDRMNQLSDEVEKMSITIDNLIEILSINDRQTEIPEQSVDRLDEVRDRFLELRDTDTYHSMIETLESMSRETERLVVRYKELLVEMCRDYMIGDALPDRASACVPLVDRTFELYATMKKEVDEMIRTFEPSNIQSSSNKESEDESNHEGGIDIHSMILVFKQYLATQTVSLQSVVSRTARLEEMDECARLILQDDSQLFMSIEMNHKKLITCRSSLKHKIADMEDAEEQDESDKFEQLSKEIQDIRASLHEHLQASRDIIKNGETCKVMQRKPELQLKNQSILFTGAVGDGNETVFPLFLWDNIFFNIPRESQSSSSSLKEFKSAQDKSSDYFITEFLSSPVCMKRLSLSHDNYSSVVRNLSTYSCRAALISDSLVSLMPVTLAFISRSEGNALYLMLPTFAPQQKLPSAVTDTIPALIDFCRSIIDHIVSLWHLGFTFTDQDLSYGGLLMSSVDQPDRSYLPLPLCSIFNREDISLSSRSSSSLQICFSRLAALMQQCLSKERDDLTNVPHDLVSGLIGTVSRCTTIDEAESLCTELDSFLETVLKSQQPNTVIATLDDNTAPATEVQDTSVNNSDHDSSLSSSLNDNGSSIEQIEQPEEEEPPVSPKIGDESLITEEILETVYDVE